MFEVLKQRDAAAGAHTVRALRCRGSALRQFLEMFIVADMDCQVCRSEYASQDAFVSPPEFRLVMRVRAKTARQILPRPNSNVTMPIWASTIK